MALTTRAIEWLQDRGIDGETASRYGVESCENRSGELLSFAYMLGGEHVNSKFRPLGDKRFWMTEGGRLCFWNANTLNDHELRRSTPLIVTEGELDALSAIEAGFPHVVSVPNGAPGSDAEDQGQRYAWLEQHMGQIDHSSIILAVDNDQPGARLYRDFEIRFGKSRCRFIRWPPGCKDLNDILLKHGAAGVVEHVTQAPWAAMSGLYTLDTLPPEPIRTPLSTGVQALDPLWKIRLGELTVVSGIPNCGKTEWVCDIACRTAERYGWRVSLGSFEDQPRTTLVPRLERWCLGKAPMLASERETHETRAWIREHFAFIVPTDDDDPDLTWLIERIKASVIRFEAKLVIVDPWNELEHLRPPDLSLTEYVGAAIRALKQLARNLGIHMIVVAHPAKGGAQHAKKGEPITLYDIADSAHWSNKPDVGIIVQRDYETGNTKIHVRKVRFQPEVGEPGTAHLRFNRMLGRFEEAAIQDELL